MTEGLEQLTLTVEETATILGIPRRSVYEHIARGLLPAIELGRRKLVLKEAIEQLRREAMERANALAAPDV